MTAKRSRNPRGQGDRLRQELIEAASRLLEQAAGEDSLSLRAVAREAGVAAPSVYRHFADLGELMAAVLQHRFAQFAATLAAAEPPDATPAQLLTARCRAYCDYAVEHPGPYRVMFATLPSSPPPPDVELIGVGLVDDLAARIADRIDRQPSDPVTRQRAFVLWATLHGLATLPASKPAPSWPDRDRLIDEALAAACRP